MPNEKSSLVLFHLNYNIALITISGFVFLFVFFSSLLLYMNMSFFFLAIQSHYINSCAYKLHWQFQVVATCLFLFIVVVVFLLQWYNRQRRQPVTGDKLMKCEQYLRPCTNCILCRNINKMKLHSYDDSISLEMMYRNRKWDDEENELNWQIEWYARSMYYDWVYPSYRKTSWMRLR